MVNISNNAALAPISSAICWRPWMAVCGMLRHMKKRMKLGEALSLMPNKSAVVSTVGARSIEDLDVRIRRAFSKEIYDHWKRLPVTGFGPPRRRFSRSDILEAAAKCDSMRELRTHIDIHKEAIQSGLLADCADAIRKASARRKRIDEASEHRNQKRTHRYDLTEINKRIDKVFGRGERWAS